MNIAKFLLSIRMHREVRALAWVAFAYFVHLAIGLSLLKLLTNELTISEFAHYSILISLGGLLASYPFGPLDQFVQRSLPRLSPAQAPSFCIQAFVAYGCLLLLIPPIVLRAVDALQMHLKFIDSVILWFLVTGIVYRNVSNAIENYNGSRSRSAQQRIAEQMVKIILVSGLIATSCLTTSSVLIAFALAAWTVTVFQVWRHINAPWKIDQLAIRQFLNRGAKFGWPLLIWGAFSYLQSSACLWTLQRLADPIDVGAWSVSLQLSVVVPQATMGILATIVGPRIYRADDPKLVKMLVRGITIIFLIVCLTLIIVFFLFGKEVMGAAANKDLISYSWMLAPIALGTSIWQLGAIPTLEMFKHNVPQKLLWANVIPGIISVPLAMIGWRMASLSGVVGSYLLVQLLGAGLSWGSYVVWRGTSAIR